MSAISIRLPDSLHRRVRELARRENVSINQVITLALAEKLSALDTEDYLGNRARRATKVAFAAAVKKVPDVETEEHERL